MVYRLEVHKHHNYHLCDDNARSEHTMYKFRDLTYLTQIFFHVQLYPNLHQVGHVLNKNDNLQVQDKHLDNVSFEDLLYNYYR